MTTYLDRRGQIETYFDRTAAEAWARLTSDAPVGRVRASVRAGRDRMRATLLSWLPADLAGLRVLDAGCGTGALAVQAAHRGAEVLAIDLSPTLVDLARQRQPVIKGGGRIEFRSGDMLAPELGHFDYVVGMDSVIHYETGDAVGVLAGLAERTRLGLLFTFVPSSPALEAFRAVGKLFPRGDRSPAVVPVSERWLHRRIDDGSQLPGWKRGRTERVSSGFYTSQALELVRSAASAEGNSVHSPGRGLDMNPVLKLNSTLASQWARIGTRFLPFADAATTELPLPRLMRLALFQVTVGMAMVLLVGTLNRVMIVELGVAAWLVSAMVAVPLVFAPFRALIGFRSDTHKSVLGWKRVPYIWIGTLLQFGGLAIMPFALILLSGDSHGPAWISHAGAALAFLLVGAGLQTTQTAGLALATDLAPPAARPRVVALMYVMLLLGMVVSGLLFGVLLRHFSQVKLIQVVQGAGLLTMVLNLVALWKQEARDPANRSRGEPRPAFRAHWARFAGRPGAVRFLVAVGLGTAAFNMQDIILEPYGGEVLHLPVGATTTLTAMMALGALAAFALAARVLGRGRNPHSLAAWGLVAGLVAFSCVIFAEPLASPNLFRIGATLIGFGGGLFSVGTLTAAMNLEHDGLTGLALGAWGAVQASCAGVAIAAGGAVRDLVSSFATQGLLGPALHGTGIGYSFVYHVELYLLFATLIAIGPLVRRAPATAPAYTSRRFGIAELPG